MIPELRKEIERCEELVSRYNEIPTGAFGAAMIQHEIDAANEAIDRQDAVAMVRALSALRECQ